MDSHTFFFRKEMTISMDKLKLTGLLLAAGAAQFILILLFLEATTPGYNAFQNYISELGIGSTALLFNSSLIALGLLFLLAAILVFRTLQSTLFSTLLGITAISAIGIGVFPMNVAFFHTLFSYSTFFFATLTILSAYKVAKPPFNAVAIFLGVFTLLAMAFFISGIHLGLGIGAVERLVAYPPLLGAFLLGCYFLMGLHVTFSNKNRS